MYTLSIPPNGNILPHRILMVIQSTSLAQIPSGLVVLIYVCLCVCVGLSVHHHSEDTEQFHFIPTGISHVPLH